MKPRIIVSSIFYDLKYIREDLSNFIKAHDFEPILFEDGDMRCPPFSSLDDSCSGTIESADMILLIVGSNYSSPASGEIHDEFNEVISVTCQEIQKGIERGIPFYVFVDRSMYAEYEIYDMNSNEINSGEYKINFWSTKNINVFRFIKEIHGFNQVTVTTFETISDIKDFLSKQWSDIFKNYLSTLKEQNPIEKLQGTMQETISKMNDLIEKMDKILNVVGKEALKKSEEEYKQMIEENKKAEVKAICMLLARRIRVDVDKAKGKNRRNHIMGFLTSLNEMYDQLEELAKDQNFQLEELFIDDSNIVTKTFVEALENFGMSIRSIKDEIYKDKNKIHPYLSDPDKRKEIYILLCSGEYYYRIFRVINKDMNLENNN